MVVKGGHLRGVEPSDDTAPPSEVPDVLFDGTDVTVLAADRVATTNTHGTGCSLSAAIAARLAGGADVPTAVRDAKALVHRALVGAAGWRLGGGHGPIDHFGWTHSGTRGRVRAPGPGTTAAGS